VRHHLLDLVDPGEEFTVVEFQQAARAALSVIEGRGGRALLVGGTGLYLRAVVDDLNLPGRWPDIASALGEEAATESGLAQLYDRLAILDPVGAGKILPTNRRRVVRALEVTLGAGRPFSSYGPGLATYPPTRFVLLGVPFHAAEADRRIEDRFRALLQAGLLEEVAVLSARPGGLSRTARQALGYKELLAYLAGDISLDDAISEAVRRTRAFARRQWAWFRRDPRIRWLDSSSDLLGQLVEAWDGARPDATMRN
jgi:tRNA dimethylallyltransferase